MGEAGAPAPVFALGAMGAAGFEPATSRVRNVPRGAAVYCGLLGRALSQASLRATG
jgi:hypothetical protein